MKKVTVMRLFRTLFIVTLSIFMAACTLTQTISQVSDIRSIQEDFDTASRMQIDESSSASDMSMQGGTAQIMQLNQSLMLFQRVINNVDKLEMQKSQLMQDGLWVNLQTLKAMSQWQIGDKEGALTTAKQAIEQAQGATMQSRDMIMLNAIPSLVANDEAFDLVQDLKIAGNKDNDAYQVWLKATNLYQKAESELTTIINNVAHPQLQFYLQLSRLTVITNWENSFDLELCDTLSDPSNCDATRDAKIEQSKDYFDDLLVSRYKIMGSCEAVKTSQFYTFWLTKIGSDASSQGSFKKLCP